MGAELNAPVHTNLPAERMILGALLHSEAAYWQVSEIVKQEHFSRAIHGQVFAAVRDLCHEGKRVSLQALIAKIGAEYESGLSTANLLSALRRDAEDADDTAIWLDMVDLVVDAWRLRRTNDLAGWVKQQVGKPGIHGDDLLADMKARIEEIDAASNSQPIKWIGEVAKRATTSSKAAMDGDGIGGFDTGLASLDEILGRIHAGDLGFVLAAPGDGKTVIGAQLAMRAALTSVSMYFQLEMRDEDMARRALAGEAGLSVSEIEEGALDFIAYENLIRAQERLMSRRMAIDDRPKLRIEQIRDRCVSMKRSHGLGLIVIDHLRLVRTNAKVRDKFERAEHVTSELKSMAKELQIAVVCLSQVTRSSQRREDPTPQRSDGDGGSSIEQDADWAIALLRRDRWMRTHRPRDAESPEFAEWLKSYEQAKGKIEITTLKRRRGEDGERREFLFDGRASMIREIDQ